MTGLKSMVGRFSLLIIVFALGVASVSLWPSLPQSLRKTLGLASTPGAAQLRADTSGAPTPAEAGTEKQEIKLTKEQIADAHIDLVAAQPASLARRITVPGSITPALAGSRACPSSLRGQLPNCVRTSVTRSSRTKFWPSSKAAKSRMPRVNTSPPGSATSCSRSYFSATGNSMKARS